MLIADEFSSANLLWAGNTLTTNGVSRSRQLTGVVISRDAGGARAGPTAAHRHPGLRACADVGHGYAAQTPIGLLAPAGPG